MLRCIHCQLYFVWFGYFTALKQPHEVGVFLLILLIFLRISWYKFYVPAERGVFFLLSGGFCCVVKKKKKIEVYIFSGVISPHVTHTRGRETRRALPSPNGERALSLWYLLVQYGLRIFFFFFIFLFGCSWFSRYYSSSK